ncbi:hypothetical protein B0H14DRAFT_2531784 [Mycena olivaceomarginata]|nr:hypothetical protein B0H14DRAFT_2531784 [Mycena olivaceomarginata]
MKYPVLALPHEIICDIFIHFLPVYPSCPPLTGPHSPILLTHICGEWRRIALAFPALWRAIEISCDDPAWLLSVALGRSGSSPLSIRVDEMRWSPGNERVELVSTVLSHRERWQYLSLCLVGLETGYPSIGGPMPLLQHLNVEFDYEYDMDAMPVPSFAEAPLLRTAILSDSASKGIILPWAQLTSLTLQLMYLSACVPVLQKAANLTHCELELYHYDDFDETSVADVVLPSLQSLTLNDVDPQMHRVDLLQTFIVPALSRLEIPERFLGPNAIDSLSSFISKSGCRLQRVDIVDRSVVPENSYRTAFPSILMSSTLVYVGD